MLPARLLSPILLLTLLGARPALAYVDLAPSLPRIVGDAPTIAVVEVAAFDRQQHVVTLRAVQALKGDLPAELIAHQVAPIGGTAPRQIRQWAVPGARAVLFQSRSATRGTALVSFGTGWYQVTSAGTGPWKLGQERPDLPLAYYGSLPRLTNSIQLLLGGQGAVITTVAYGTDGAAASIDLALNRQSLPGVIKLSRLRVTPSMASATMGTMGAFIGSGVVDERDLPALAGQLTSAEADIRLQAVEDLRSLGRRAKSLAPAVARLLEDSSPQVRHVAASALLRLAPKDARGVPLLLAGMKDASVAVRGSAASAAGYAGANGAPLADALALLLGDPDESVRLTALESLSMLGPTAAGAGPALTTLLDDKELAIDAADALGRIGPAAAPALGKLAALLKSPQITVRWAAVRGMAQIGGPEAHPAVDFMVKNMAGSSEVEGYNMMIYFAFLGPVAKDGVHAIQTFNMKNPMLPNVAQWAINPNRFPWEYPGAPSAPNPSASPFAGMAGFGGMNAMHFSAFVSELGPRLGPLAPKLAQAILDKSAGTVPLWGYQLLVADAPAALQILTPGLKHADLAQRERAAVGLGYMGPAAAPALPELTAAAARAATEREKNLLEWAIRQIDD